MYICIMNTVYYLSNVHLYNEYCILNNVLYTLYNVQWTLYSVQCTLNNIYYTLYNEQWTMNNDQYIIPSCTMLKISTI